MVMDDPVQKIPTTLVTADSTGAPDAGGHGSLDLTGIEKRPKAEKDNCCWLLPKIQLSLFFLIVQITTLAKTELLYPLNVGHR